MPHPLREAGCSRRERREYRWPPLPFLEPIPAHESALLEAGTDLDIRRAHAWVKRRPRHAKAPGKQIPLRLHPLLAMLDRARGKALRLRLGTSPGPRPLRWQDFQSQRETP
jgi:hypothetical protein